MRSSARARSGDVMNKLRANLACTAALLLSHAAVSARPPPERITYFYTNANQVAVLDLEAGHLSLGEEAMAIKDCSPSTGMPCLSIPYLSLEIAFSEKDVSRGSWYSGDRLFCVKKAVSVSDSEIVYLIASAVAVDCSQIGGEATFMYSNRRGLLMFSKKGTEARLVFTLLDPRGFGAR